MKIEPLYDRLLVKRDPAEKTTKAGLIIPGQVETQERCAIGTVVAVGEGRIDTERQQVLRVKKNDRVLFGRNAGVQIHADENLRILREEDVLAIVRE